MARDADEILDEVIDLVQEYMAAGGSMEELMAAAEGGDAGAPPDPMAAPDTPPAMEGAPVDEDPMPEEDVDPMASVLDESDEDVDLAGMGKAKSFGAANKGGAMQELMKRNKRRS